MTRQMMTSRRTLLGASAAATGVLAAPNVLRRAWAAEPIRVSSYGGYFEDSLKSYAYPNSPRLLASKSSPCRRLAVSNGS